MGASLSANQVSSKRKPEYASIARAQAKNTHRAHHKIRPNSSGETTGPTQLGIFCLKFLGSITLRRSGCTASTTGTHGADTQEACIGPHWPRRHMHFK